VIDEVKVVVALAELKVMQRELTRMKAYELRLFTEAERQRRRAEHHLEVKRAMHRTLDALYRKTKAERDAARAAEREAIAAKVEEMTRLEGVSGWDSTYSAEPGVSVKPLLEWLRR
jgi:phage-related minor tail protein